MKNVIKGIVVTLAALVIIVVGGAYLISPVAQVERTAVIKAPPEKVYAIVSSMKRFNEWSPWFSLDPKAEYSFEGARAGYWSKDDMQIQRSEYRQWLADHHRDGRQPEGRHRARLRCDGQG